jgi:hypothetical protein
VEIPQSGLANCDLNLTCKLCQVRMTAHASTPTLAVELLTMLDDTDAVSTSV